MNLKQVHGFPQIMGVLTHLDMIKNKKQLKKVKKTLKHRFWTEVYAGSKLFYLSGYHPLTQSYPKNEVHNLARFISVMKFRPTLWRTEHAYLVADRLEDLTNPESVRVDPKVDRTVCLYGYVHGTFLKPRVSVHIPGLGDFLPEAVAALSDPCPLPMKERVLRRSLNEKEKLIYAPFSGVGGIVYDKDAVYIDLGGSHSHKKAADEEKNASNPMIGELQDLKSTLDEKMEAATIKLFSTSDAITAAEVEIPEEGSYANSEEEQDNKNEAANGHEGNEKDGDSGEEDDEDEELNTDDELGMENMLRESDSEDDTDDDDDDEDDQMNGDDSLEGNFEKTLAGKIDKSKARRVEEAADAFYSRFRNRSMQKMIYDDTADFMNVSSRADFDTANCDPAEKMNLEELEEEEIKDFFVGGDYADAAKKLLDADDDEDPFGDDMFGDFEELDGKGGPGGGDDVDEGEEKKKKEPKEDMSEEKREEMKKKLKEKFDMEYDDGGDKNFLKEWKSQVEEQAQVCKGIAST